MADPVTPPGSQGLNRYSHTFNNPIKYTDPDGHCPMCVGAALGAAAGAGIAYGSQVVANISRDGASGKAFSDVSWSAVGAGAVAGAVGGATFGVGTAVMGTSLAAYTASGAVSGAVAGQVGRAMENRLEGNPIQEGLGNPTDIARDAAVGAVMGGVAKGVTQGIEAWQGRSVARLAEAGETFRHYGYAEHAANFGGGLRPGSFAAPSTEPLVSGLDAVERYALPPKPSPPNAYYNVEPPSGTAVIGPRRVMPRLWWNGIRPEPHLGLGLEVQFPEGTPPGSVTGPWPLPGE